MLKRILCPFHEERTPSCTIYPTGFKCYGCGRTGKLEELGMDPKTIVLEPRYVENVEESVSYIKSLPLLPIRGLSFHSDGDYYYVLWRDGKYYNRRNLNPEVSWKQKYKCPSGVKKPLFTVRDENRMGTLVICEGEINALSIAQACEEVDVVSPGGSGDFYGPRVESDLRLYSQYKRVLIVADADKAGAIAAIELKSRLIPLVKDVSIKLMSKDANDWLVADGKEALAKEIKGSLGMSGGVSYAS